MNKKLFGTLLLGSLLLGGTFVSCKDYDDDIKNLQEQISNLATKSDVETKLGQLQSALTAAQQKAEEALAAAKSADNSAEVKALSEKLDKIAEAQAAVDAALEATKNEISEQLADFDEATKQMIADAQKKTEETVGKVADYVTSVSLELSMWGWPWVGPVDQQYVTITEKDNVFGKDIDGEITFVKGTQVQRPAKSIIVSVSPTNAELTPEMISLVDSKGRNLDELLDIVKVERADDILITRATNSSLWKITTALKEYDKKKFEAAALTKVGNATERICYAVQINNSLSVAEDRHVTSTYDIALYTSAYNPVGNLSYFVGAKPIADIKNRATVTGGAPEYVWAAGPDVAIKKDLSNVTTGDNRSGKALYPLVQGEKVTITLDETGATDVKNASAANIKALYVTLDEANAVESKPSELNAWNSYSYTGLNTVVEGNKIEISVNGETAVSDIIGFRVYAVNWDGTLVDPDGSAFYVKVGNAGDEFTGIPVVKTPMNTADKTGASAKVTMDQQKSAADVKFSTDKNDEDVSLTWAVKVGTTTYTTTAALVTAFQTKDGLKDAIVELTPDKALDVVKDGKAYTGKFEVKDADGFLLYTVPVSYTKTIPTTVPEGFTVKTNQVVNGIYNCYLVPTTATAATTGSMAMDQIFNFGKGTPAMYEISFAESTKNAKNELIAIDVVGTGSITVAKDYIDNKTEHATSVSYNYGKISSEAKDKNGAIIDYKVATDISFKTVYNCVYNSLFTWAYATRAQLGGLYNTYNDPAHPENGYKADPWNHELTYGTASTVKVEEFIYGSTSIDSKYCGILMNLKSSTYNALTYKANSAKLITKSNSQVNEYFKVEDSAAGLKFTVEPTSSNPTGDVDCTLEMTYTDAYGHDVKVSVDVTVKKR